MRSIASSARRVTCSVFLATLFTLVGCGGTSLRRPLVTDQTPLGSTREDVREWFAVHGWCANPKPARWGANVAFYRPCAGPDRARIATVLRFKNDGSLFAAWVFAKVPRPIDAGPRTAPIWSGVEGPHLGVRYEPGAAGEPPARAPLRRPPRSSSGDRDPDPAMALLDALAVEIEARHGQGVELAPSIRTWKTKRETIMMYVARGWVVEAHWPSVCSICLPD